MWKRLQSVYSQIKQSRLKPLIIGPPPPMHPVSYQPPTHRRLLAYPLCVFNELGMCALNPLTASLKVVQALLCRWDDESSTSTIQLVWAIIYINTTSSRLENQCYSYEQTSLLRYWYWLLFLCCRALSRLVVRYVLCEMCGISVLLRYWEMRPFATTVWGLKVLLCVALGY